MSHRFNDEQGQTSIEYAMLVSLVIVLVGALTALTGAFGDFVARVGDALGAVL